MQDFEFETKVCKLGIIGFYKLIMNWIFQTLLPCNKETKVSHNFFKPSITPFHKMKPPANIKNKQGHTLHSHDSWKISILVMFYIGSAFGITNKSVSSHLNTIFSEMAKIKIDLRLNVSNLHPHTTTCFIHLVTILLAQWNSCYKNCHGRPLWLLVRI